MKKWVKILITLVSVIFLFVGALCFFSANWYRQTYGDTGFDSILFTLFGGLGGVGNDLVTAYVKKALLPAIAVLTIVSLLLFPPLKKYLTVTISENRKLKLYPFPKVVALILAMVISGTLLYQAADRSGLFEYIGYLKEESTFIEEHYVNPQDTNITFPEEKRNLIYILLESMEITMLSRELGGGNDINTIPELYELAENNINFSQNDSVGGFTALTGSGWTIGAIVSQTAGVPLKTPINIGGNDYGQEHFLPGLFTLSNVLQENGYYQSLMVGSDATFGGRKQYFEQHGTDRIYDLFTAREDGIIEPEYEVWWGMEDYYLVEYAKQELPKIAAQEQPFAFTMLTVDTHHVDGYRCAYCVDEYPEQYENVFSCSSRQVAAFVKWIQEQDFYENTTVIICGDHPSMDWPFMERNVPEDYDRRVYNCILNAPVSGTNTKNREFCTFDMFPTTLAALGCRIEGDRLGLGTNLFSDAPTLCETLGVEEFDVEVAKYSLFYAKTFY